MVTAQNSVIFSSYMNKELGGDFFSMLKGMCLLKDAECGQGGGCMGIYKAHVIGLSSSAYNTHIFEYSFI